MLADKHQRVLQVNTKILGLCGQACPNYPKKQVWYFFAIYYERSEWWGWFFHADEWESLLQSNTLISMGVVKHSQSFWNGKFAISLQNLEKEVRDL